MTALPIYSRFALRSELHPGYALRRLRGRGGFGEVWEAEADDGRLVALKFLPCPKGQGAPQELRSIQMVRDLSHPNLTRVEKVWCAPGYLVVAMELADGSLADLLEVYRAEVGQPLPPDHLCPLLAQAARALDFLNTQQHLANGQWVTIQHCDVTPPNLLLFGTDVKLTDFGLTTALGFREKAHFRAGTPDYAAPEVFQGRVSDRTDQYALAVCYCLLRSGRLPFPDTPPDFAPGYVRPAPDLSMLQPAEQAAVARALAPVPHERWRSCGELIAELTRATAPTAAPAAAPPPAREPTERRREPRYAPRAGVGCAVLGTLGNGEWEARILNVSAGGARLRVARPVCALRPGRVLELALTNPARAVGVLIRLLVTHAVEREGGDYEVGGGFDRPLSPGELEALTDGRAV